MNTSYHTNLLFFRCVHISLENFVECTLPSAMIKMDVGPVDMHYYLHASSLLKRKYQTKINCFIEKLNMMYPIFKLINFRFFRVFVIIY